ncbi:MAG TPA: lysylphosphatidylglycerol synthase domain-containing protein [Thermoanaerobaculia bacterium]|nr:lysylphosphatidylglycerol synthase domain-containing protein [Thermoanaerobaculia bacterium]
MATPSRLELDGAAQAPPEAPREAPRPRRGLRIALLAVGLAAALFVFRTVGWPAVSANLARIGGWFAALVAIYAAAQLAFAAGWWVLFEPGPRRPGLLKLFAVYLAGDSFNYVAPGGVAGEPVKAKMLAGISGTRSAVASLTIHKHADMLAQWLFIAAGVGVALARFSMPLAAKLAAIAGVVALGAGLLALTWALRRGTYSPAVRLLSRWKFLARRLEWLHRPAQDLDDRIRDFYSRRLGRYAASTAWCSLGWCGGLLETWIVLQLLSPGAGWDAAFAIEALAMTLNNMFLLIPARIGTAEGIRVGVFLLLGLAAGPGAAYSLVRRGRELVWTVPGFAAFFHWQAKEAMAGERRN